MRSKSLFVVVFLIVGMESAAAPELARIELTPYVGYRGGGHYFDGVGDAEFENDVTFGFVADYRATYNTQWELLYGHYGAQIDDSAASLDGSKLDLDLDYLHVGGTYVFDGELFRPFISVTIGATRLEPDDSEISTETYFSGSFGVGMRFEMARNLGLRLEARTFGLFGKSNSLVFCSNFEGDEGCFLAGDGGVIPQLEFSGGVTFRF